VLAHRWSAEAAIELSTPAAGRASRQIEQGIGVSMAQSIQLQRSKSRARQSRSELEAVMLGDTPLLAAVGALLVIGLMMIYSGSFDLAYQEKGDAAFYVGRQLVFMIVGLGVTFLLARSDYAIWRRWSVTLMGGVLALLVLVLIGGSDLYGAQRSFFNGSIQPSELAKLVLIIYIADWLASKGDKIQTTNYGLLPFAVIVGLITGLILMQPDYGTAVLIVLTAVAMFFMAGADLKQLLTASLIGGATILILMLVTDHTRIRLFQFMAGMQDPTAVSDQMKQVTLALKTGGLSGVGLGNGILKIGYLPLAHSDSIFALIALELGLVGVLALLCLYGVVAYRGYRIAMHAADTYGRLLAFGATTLIVLQALINIGAMTGTLPLTGIPLPFVSHGGSSLITMMAAIGVLISVSRGTRKGITYSALVDRSRRNRRSRVSRLGSR
jgi:cell division protein FtsW